MIINIRSARIRDAKNLIDQMVSDAMPFCGHQKLHFQNVLYSIMDRSSLLDVRKMNRRGVPEQVEKVIRLTSKIARLRDNWQRHIGYWSADEDDSAYMQLKSLVHFLFAQYPVPGFMTKFWIDGEELDCKLIKLFLELGKGISIRSFDLPIRLNKTMARALMRAPEDLDLNQALRWAQAKGLDASDTLARGLLSTILSEPTASEEFWESVIRFLIKFEVSNSEAEEIINFIQSQKFEAGGRVIWWGGPDPLQPDFSLKGRTLRSLRRHMVNWQTELEPIPREVPLFDEHGKLRSWEPMYFRDFQCTQEGNKWTITEILNSAELKFEGSIMRHCVGQYVKACQSRRTSIWSLRKEVAGKKRRHVTIEVSPAGEIIQAKAHFNERPKESEINIIQKWAKAEGLKI